MFDLIAGVYRQAIRDAKCGKRDAIEWLDVVAPDWREYLAKPRVKQSEINRGHWRGVRNRDRGVQISSALEV